MPTKIHHKKKLSLKERIARRQRQFAQRPTARDDFALAPGDAERAMAELEAVFEGVEVDRASLRAGLERGLVSDAMLSKLRSGNDCNVSRMMSGARLRAATMPARR